MSQTICDHPGFFAGYSQLPRSIGGLESANERPAIAAGKGAERVSKEGLLF